MGAIQPLPLGVSDFKKLIDESFAYVDKTLLIEEMVELPSQVVLISRPRRFGKTLSLSMLRYFFEKSNADTGYLFQSLNVWENEKCKRLQGQFPVVSMTLKDVKCASWSEAFRALRGVIADEFRRHRYLLEILAEDEQDLFNQIIFEKGEAPLLERSLLHLSHWLWRYHKQRVIVLLDEYDTPIHFAFVEGYYDAMIVFMRNWLSAGLKDNPALERGIITGILRIAKESMFSGLNHIPSFTLLQGTFQDKFGFLESEVQGLLQKYDLQKSLDAVRGWYDGYRIGSCEGVYNPWSVLNCIAKKGILDSYWVNTSDNLLAKRLIAQGSSTLKNEMEPLLKGETLEKVVEENIVFSNLKNDPNTFWALLLFSGYLTLGAPFDPPRPCRLRIPNREVEELFRNMILEWFRTTIHSEDYTLLIESLLAGEIETFAHVFEEFFLSAFSVFDIPSRQPERVYHAFILGCLVCLRGRYDVKSNRESGLGRYDVTLIPNNPEDLGIVMEFKRLGPKDKTSLAKAAALALKQIEGRQYDQELKDHKVERILHLGFAFRSKQVLIKGKLCSPMR